MLFRLFSLCLISASVLTGCSYTRMFSDYTPVYFEEVTESPCQPEEIQQQFAFIIGQLLDRLLTDNRYTCQNGKPLFVFTGMENFSDLEISSGMILDIIEEVSIIDGRFITDGKFLKDEEELGSVINKIIRSLKCSSFYRVPDYYKGFPQFLTKITLEKNLHSECCPSYENYCMTVTLYDPYTKEEVDSESNIFWERFN